ncbi:hypothetical protein I3842_08G169600 [Carya illinoinensis]|uniref:Uncharacterized protein n=1 Tax=Carya illinoinensis TaxID=32201 RepID=A0A922JC50_CARIL|nr:hypothetical protein I3842_08G169600 [Carya illinoinensis]
MAAVSTNQTVGLSETFTRLRKQGKDFTNSTQSIKS